MTILRAIMNLLGCQHESPDPVQHVSVDIAAILDAKVAEQGRALDWRHSVVDLLEALNMSSDIKARSELAVDLGLPGIEVGSSAGNERLRLELMRRVADNGGKVPEELIESPLNDAS